MALCPVCGSKEHPSWKAHVFVNTERTPVNTLRRAVNTMQSNVRKGRDRHQEGYMRKYMAVMRAVKAGRACRWPKTV